MKNTEEQWRVIEGYKGAYEVSTLGRVRSLDRIVSQMGVRGFLVKRVYKGYMLKQREPKNGYKYVHLSKNGIRKTYKIHRLVATTFIENPENFPEVNHKDGVKSNNCVDNLEWCSSSMNKRHAVETGLLVNPKGCDAHNYRGDVEVIDNEGCVVEILRGHEDIISKGYSSCGVSAVLTGRQKTHRGYKFRIKEVNDGH